MLNYEACKFTVVPTRTVQLVVLLHLEASPPRQHQTRIVHESEGIADGRLRYVTAYLLK
jgi:hypothetical protein